MGYGHPIFLPAPGVTRQSVNNRGITKVGGGGIKNGTYGHPVGRTTGGEKDTTHPTRLMTPRGRRIIPVPPQPSIPYARDACTPVSSDVFDTCFGLAGPSYTPLLSYTPLA